MLFRSERIGQGRENTKDFLREHPEVAQAIEGKIRARFGLMAAAGREGPRPEGHRPEGHRPEAARSEGQPPRVEPPKSDAKKASKAT